MAAKESDIVYGEISYESEQRHLDNVIKEVTSNVDMILDENKKSSTEISSMLYDIKYMDNEQRRDYRSRRSSLDESISNNNILATESKKVKTVPYFGRIDINHKNKKTAPKTYYLSIHPNIRRILKSRSNIEYVNWRAPIGNQYYMTSRAGEYVFPDGVGPATVQLKSPIVIEKHKVTKIDEYNILGQKDGEAEDISLLQEKLSSSSSSKMTEVVETIQDEQNSLIRIPEDKNVIIQGSAGSGKSIVGLHRIAYLMYEGHKNPLKDYQTLFISPNTSFSDYISNVLPSLGENNIPILTINTLVSIALRGSGYALNESRIHKYFKDGVLDPSIKNLYSNEMSERFSDLVDMIKDDLKFYNSIVEQAEWHHINIKLTKQTYKQYLEDADFLEPYREHINKNVYSCAGVYEAIVKALLTNAEIRSSVNSDGTINFELYDDGTRLKNKKIIEFNDKMDEEETPEKKKKILGENLRQIRQVVIDEAQDYTKWHIYLLRKLFPNAHFTILGDENQNINPYIENNKLKDLAPDFEYIEINKAYRSSPEIINFTNNILGTKIVPIRKPNGLPVKEYWNIGTTIRSSLKQMLIRDILRFKANGHKRIAVITRSGDEAKEFQSLSNSENKFTCLPVYKAKGLEFDAVIIFDNYLPNEQEMYYTACTRAQHELTVYHWAPRNIYA